MLAPRSWFATDTYLKVPTMLPLSVFRRSSIKTLLCGCTALSLAACQGVAPEAAQVAAAPHSRLVKPVTPYSDSLGCLGRMLAAQKAAAPERFPIYLLVGTVPDTTGKISVGLRDIVTNTIVKANASSQAFELHEALSTGSMSANGNPLTNIGGVGIGNVNPNFYQVIGSLSQADNNVQTASNSAGLGYAMSSAGVSRNSSLALFGIDMRVSKGDIVMFAVTNLMALKTSSEGMSADFKIGSVGINFDHELDRNEGAHQAARTLVEYSVVELLGRLAGYHFNDALLATPQTLKCGKRSPPGTSSHSEQEQENYIRNRLIAVGFVDLSTHPEQFHTMIRQYQEEHDIAISGRVDFETFASLADAQLNAPGGSRDQNAPTSPNTPVNLPEPAPAGPPRMRLDVLQTATNTPRLQLGITVDRLAYVACYYRDEDDDVSRSIQTSSSLAPRSTAMLPPVFPLPSAVTPSSRWNCRPTGIPRTWAFSVPRRQAMRCFAQWVPAT